MNFLGKKKGLDTDPLTQTVETVGPRGEKVVLKPVAVQATEGDAVEGFGNVLQDTAAMPKPRFEIKGVIRIN